MIKLHDQKIRRLRDGPFDIQGGGVWDFLNFFSLPEQKKINVFNKVKNITFVLHSVYLFEAIYPGSYKSLQ